MSDSRPTDSITTSELSEEDLEAVLQESARQEQDDFQESLQERDRGLQALEEAQQILEDQLEDSNAEVDRLQRELDRAVVEAEEAEYPKREAEEARKQLEITLYNIQEGVEDAKVIDLRDERMHRTKRSLDMGDVVTRRPFWLGVVIGGLVTALTLAVAFIIYLFKNAPVA